MSINLGVIGFGQVGATFAAAMRRAGACVMGHDAIPDKVTAAGFACLSPAELAEKAECLIVTVTTQNAEACARAWAPHLRAGHLYVDLNSTSPEEKVSLAAIVSATGAAFAEGAILGAVGVSGANTQILTGGPGGEAAAAILNSAGLRAAFFSPETGKASLFKMLRSVFSKGVEALLIELLAAGRAAGLEAELWRELEGLFADNAFGRVARNWVQTHPGACERRYHEMTQVCRTLAGLGITPIMARATEAFFDRSRRLGLAPAADSGEALAAVGRHLIKRPL